MWRGDGGDAVGPALGDALGLLDGEAVGPDEGEALGDVDGEAVGPDEGEALGDVDGEAVGPEGQALGERHWVMSMEMQWGNQ